MTKVGLAKRVAEIIVYGHIALFLFAFVVFLIGPHEPSDTIEMVLMGSPLLTVVAASAFQYLANQVVDDGTLADPPWARMTQILSVVFLAALFSIYVVACFEIGISAETIKMMVGVVETGLGVYLGSIRRALFPDQVDAEPEALPEANGPVPEQAANP